MLYWNRLSLECNATYACNDFGSITLFPAFFFQQYSKLFFLIVCADQLILPTSLSPNGSWCYRRVFLGKHLGIPLRWGEWFRSFCRFCPQAASSGTHYQDTALYAIMQALPSDFVVVLFVNLHGLFGFHYLCWVYRLCFFNVIFDESCFSIHTFNYTIRDCQLSWPLPPFWVHALEAKLFVTSTRVTLFTTLFRFYCGP